jgi:hypothetical protein
LVTEPYTLATDYVRAVKFSPDGKRLYSGVDSTPPAVRAFGADDWRLLWDTAVGSGNPDEITVAPNGLDILVCTSEGLHIVGAEDGAVRGSLLKFRSYPDEREDEERK